MTGAAHFAEHDLIAVDCRIMFVAELFCQLLFSVSDILYKLQEVFS